MIGLTIVKIAKGKMLMKDKALSSAGIPIMRFHAEKMPGIDMLRVDVLEVIRQFG
ncbi:hypothetical protein LP122_09285 [Moraxella bovis]|uniref:hypothetical protein n=1 Tax=Moraxella bovis TaxID=476 RepID=UPI002227B23B|nr:hypothetical protein [Moraxella bovis]UYZ67960.1 hypothetical protein LP122_09285 [Moraxella bovis]UZA28011.1 hypothetical protein LP119_03320 [Moraxella bovis]UZA37447.1 hypothetical protein LP101_09730 [Moraxella bovis]